MPLVPSTLITQLLSVFNSMTDGNEDTFPNGVSQAIATYASTGLVSTVDAGAVPAGAFVGSGSGTLTFSPSSCQQIIKSACVAMENMQSGGNDFLAEQIGAGVKAMSDAGKVSTTVVGVATSPSGTPSPLSGTASGTITCQSSPLVQSLKSAFSTMNNMASGGNVYLASQMATAVDTYLKSGVVATQGKGALSGDVGSGTVS